MLLRRHTGSKRRATKAEDLDVSSTKQEKKEEKKKSAPKKSAPKKAGE